MPPTILTVGHSGRSLGEFLKLLREAGVTRLVDVRPVPRSRRSPEFNRASLAAALAGAGLAYEHSAVLAGGADGPEGASPNGFWEHGGFRNLADHALSPRFQAALARLIASAAEEQVAIMGTPSVWWRCPRRIIADHLVNSGVAVAHITETGSLDEARITASARRRADGLLVYPHPGNGGRTRSEGAGAA